MKTCFLNDLIAVRPPVRVYTGLEEGCRCGCHGRYFESGSVGFARALNKAKKLNPLVRLYSNTNDLERDRLVLQHEYDAISAENAEPRSYARNALDRQVEQCWDGKVRCVAMDDAGWIDIALGNGKTITIYYK